MAFELERTVKDEPNPVPNLLTIFQENVLEAWGNFKRLLLTGDTRPTCLATGMIAATTGIYLLLPFATFANANYSLIRQFGTEEAWGCWFLGFGLCQIWAALHSMRQLRRITCFLGAVTWVIVAAGIFLANQGALSAPVFPFIAAAEAWVYLRLGNDKLLT